MFFTLVGERKKETAERWKTPEPSFVEQQEAEAIEKSLQKVQKTQQKNREDSTVAPEGNIFENADRCL